MTIPTIHTNGTPAHCLIENLTEVCLALDAALAALSETAPNGRDYYPQGPDAMKSATSEHLSRVMRVSGVKAEIMALAEAIDDVANMRQVTP